jgi:hypothetical protein
MAKSVIISAASAEKIQNTGRALPRIEPSELAAGLGAETLTERISGDFDPISLAELGNELIRRLRSTGGRPSLTGAAERCKVPLSAEAMEALDQIVKVIEPMTGTRPSLGQIASVILTIQLESLKSGPHARERATHNRQSHEADLEVSVAVVRALIEEHLKPVRDQVERLAKSMQPTASSSNESR